MMTAPASRRAMNKRRTDMEETASHPSKTLAAFAARLQFDSIPDAVMRRAEDLLLDWFGSALAGKIGRPVQTIASFARQMGPADGPCEILISRTSSTPLFAAMVNAASSHFAEQDDVHNGSVFHPAAVVFPAALAADAVAAAAAACLRFGRHPGRRTVGVPARRRRLQAAAYRQGGRRWPDVGLPGAGRLHRRAAHPGRRAGHGGRHVDRCRPG